MTQVQEQSLYYVLFYDNNDNLIGFYGTDTASGGYPWIPDMITQAAIFTDYKSALRVAEECYGYVYPDFKAIHKASVCKVTLTPFFITESNTVKKQIAEREVKERLEKIAELQAEVEKINKSIERY